MCYDVTFLSLAFKLISCAQRDQNVAADDM